MILALALTSAVALTGCGSKESDEKDPESARVFSDRADALPSTLMATPIDRSWLFVRGRTPEQVERFRLEDHPLYGELPEVQRGHAEAEI